jgi:hypothetical protein
MVNALLRPHQFSSGRQYPILAQGPDLQRPGLPHPQQLAKGREGAQPASAFQRSDRNDLAVMEWGDVGARRGGQHDETSIPDNDRDPEPRLTRHSEQMLVLERSSHRMLSELR